MTEEEITKRAEEIFPVMGIDYPQALALRTGYIRGFIDGARIEKHTALKEREARSKAVRDAMPDDEDLLADSKI
jgi:hypothetical protein